MKISNNDIIGLKVYRESGMQPIHEVKGVVVDPTTRRVAAITVSGKERPLILLKDIQKIRRDRIVLHTRAATHRVTDLPRTLPERSDMGSSTVISSKGVKIGKVSNIYFDTNSGKLNEIEVKRDPTTRPTTIAADAIVKIGEDITVVDNTRIAPELTASIAPQRVTAVSRELALYLQNIEMQTRSVMKELREELERLPYDNKRVLQIRAIKDKASNYIEIITRDLMLFNQIATEKINRLKSDEDAEFAVHTVRTEAKRAKEHVLRHVGQFESVLEEKANEPF